MTYAVSVSQNLNRPLSPDQSGLITINELTFQGWEGLVSAANTARQSDWDNAILARFSKTVLEQREAQADAIGYGREKLVAITVERADLAYVLAARATAQAARFAEFIGHYCRHDHEQLGIVLESLAAEAADLARMCQIASR